MKIIVYDTITKKVLIKQDNVLNPEVSGNCVSYSGGELSGISQGFILIDDMEVGDIVTDEMITLDKKSNYQKRDLEKENTELRKQLTDLSFELMMKGVL